MNPCRVCSHACRQEIDVALLSRTPQRTVVAKYGLSAGAVARHVLNHLRQPEQRLSSISNQPEHAPLQLEQTQPRIERRGEPAAWERQPGESRPAFSAFQTYLEFSAAHPEREVSYDEVGRALGKNKSLVSRWARIVRNGLNWRDRRDAWLRNLDKARAARLLQETLAARERWTTSGRHMQDLGMQKLATVNPAKLPTAEARRLVVDGATLESRGLGVERTVQVTNQQANVAISIDPERARGLVENFLKRHKNGDRELELVSTKTGDSV